MGLTRRRSNEIFLIDHSISAEDARGPAGDILWRWGNPANYHCGGPEARRLGGQHNAHFVAEDCRGAGNILLFVRRALPLRPWIPSRFSVQDTQLCSRQQSGTEQADTDALGRTTTPTRR